MTTRFWRGTFSNQWRIRWGFCLHCEQPESPSVYSFYFIKQNSNQIEVCVSFLDSFWTREPPKPTGPITPPRTLDVRYPRHTRTNKSHFINEDWKEAVCGWVKLSFKDKFVVQTWRKHPDGMKFGVSPKYAAVVCGLSRKKLSLSQTWRQNNNIDNMLQVLVVRRILPYCAESLSSYSLPIPSTTAMFSISTSCRIRKTPKCQLLDTLLIYHTPLSLSILYFILFFDF